LSATDDSELESRPRIQSVGRAAAVLYAVAASEHGLAPREISDQTGISRQTVYHLVHTLVETRLLRRSAENRIVLGLGVGSLAAGFQRHIGPQEHVRPYVQDLASRTGELAYASTWEDGEIVVVSVAKGTNVVQAREVAVGNTEDGHARASGKMLLALVTDRERQHYLDTHQLTRRTPNTISTRRRLEREIAEVRSRGYAIDDEEYEEGLCCLAVPLGASLVVIGVSVPAGRFRADPDRYINTALGVADSF
jgi:IclR family transcriptional regulator, acetate operon repressor